MGYFWLHHASSYFLGTYKRSTSAFGWCCPWMASGFLIIRSSFCSSSWCQLIIPKMYLSTGTANDPIAWILFFVLNSVPKTSLNLEYSFFSFSFSFLCCMSKLSSVPKYLYAFPRSSSLMYYYYYYYKQHTRKAWNQWTKKNSHILHTYSGKY